MNVIAYATLAYLTTAVISFLVIAVIIGLSRFLSNDSNSLDE